MIKNQDNPKAKHQCDVCLKRFVRPAELLRHVRIHTGEKELLKWQFRSNFQITKNVRNVHFVYMTLELISEQYKAIWMRNMPPMFYQKRPPDFTSKNSFNWNVLLHSLQFQNDAKWFSQTSFQKTCRHHWSKCLYWILYSTNWHKRQ